MELLQVLYPMIDDFDLLLHNRHPPGELVVLPDFPGQFFQFRIGNGLGGAEVLLGLFGGGEIGHQNSQERKPAGNEGDDNGFAHWLSTPSRAAIVFGPTIPSGSKPLLA